MIFFCLLICIYLFSLECGVNFVYKKRKKISVEEKREKCVMDKV